MESAARTLVAVVPSNAEQTAHTLYFSDGTVVGYDPALGRILHVHRLPADFGEAQAVAAGPPRRTPTVLGALPDRRKEERD
jgi:phage baseplate assembly protein gpV